MITWKDESGPFGKQCHYGYLGEIPIWTCGWGNGVKPTPYVLTCRLPGIKARTQVESVLAGEARAEKQLAAFRRLAGL